MTMREKIARAIYDKATRFDGDQIAVHLGNSMMIDGSACDAADLKRIVMQVCEDAADAALDALADPTEEMVKAGIKVTVDSAAYDAADELEVFRAMVQAAKDGA